MKKRIFTIFTLTFLLTGCSLPAPLSSLPFFKQNTACEGISVGILVADQAENQIAAEQILGYNLAVDQINQAGGVASCPITLSQGIETNITESSTQTREVVRQLVEDDKAVAILGATTNTASMQAAAMVNYFETPMIIPSAGGQHVLPDNNLWGFRLNATEDAYAKAAFSMVKDQLGEDSTVAVIFEDTTEGHDAADAAVKDIEEQGLQVAGFFPVTPVNEVAYTNLQTQISDITADVFYLAFSRTDVEADILVTLKDEQRIMTIARAGGAASSSLLWEKDGTIDPIMQQVIVATQWFGSAEKYPDEPFFSVYAAYRQQNPDAPAVPSQYVIQAYKAVQVFARTAGNVLTTGSASLSDLGAFRAALREELYAYQENDPFWGQISFASAGQNPGEIILVQALDNALPIVYPSGIADQAPFLSAVSQ